MQYLTYEEYTEIGGMLDLIAFRRSIDRASGIISNATHNRIAKMVDVPNEAKALCRDLVDYFTTHNMVTDKIVSSKSQSAGAVSESESYVVKTKDEQTSDIDDMVYDYLMSVTDDDGTPLLYRGGGCYH